MKKTLTEWIDSVGGNTAASKILDETPRTVGSWYRLERVPSFTSALNIYQKTGHVVDFNGIYCPMARKVLGLDQQ